MGGFAWVTLATNDSYSLGALVLAHSLRRVNTAHQLVVLITPSVTEAMKTQLSAVFNVVKLVDVLDSQDAENLTLLARPELGITFTKLHCWRLTEFEKCVFLDADTLVLQNSDELFEREELSAAPDAGWPDCFNSGVFVYRPSNETFKALIEFALIHGSFDGGDQGLLNLFFSDWPTKDIQKHLPFVYNMCSTATYSYLPAFKQFGQGLKIVHFIGANKPWLQPFNTETGLASLSSDSQHIVHFVQFWWDLFCANVHPSLSTEMTRHRLSSSYVFTISAQSCTPTPTFPAVKSNYYGSRPPTPPSSSFVESNCHEDEPYVYYDPWDEHIEQNHSHKTSQNPYNQYYSSVNDDINTDERSEINHNDHHSELNNEPFVYHESVREHRDSLDNSHSNNHHSDHSNHWHDHSDHSNHWHDHSDHSNHWHNHNDISNNLSNRVSHSSEPQERRGMSHSDMSVIGGGGGGDVELWSRPSRRESFSQPERSVSAPEIRHPVVELVVVHSHLHEPLAHPTIHDTPSLIHGSSSVESHPQQHFTPEPDAGLAGALASVTLGAPLTAEQSALEEHLRRQGWEQGNVDYMGKDSFSNIWGKICQTLSGGSQPGQVPTAPEEAPAPVAPVAAPVYVSSVEISPEGPIDTSPPASYAPVSAPKPTVVASDTEVATKAAPAESATVVPEPQSPSVAELISTEASVTSTAALDTSAQPSVPVVSSEAPAATVSPSEPSAPSAPSAVTTVTPPALVTSTPASAAEESIPVLSAPAVPPVIGVPTDGAATPISQEPPSSVPIPVAAPTEAPASTITLAAILQAPAPTIPVPTLTETPVPTISAPAPTKTTPPTITPVENAQAPASNTPAPTPAEPPVPNIPAQTFTEIPTMTTPIPVEPSANSNSAPILTETLTTTAGPVPTVTTPILTETPVCPLPAPIPKETGISITSPVDIPTETPVPSVPTPTETKGPDTVVSSEVLTATTPSSDPIETSIKETPINVAEAPKDILDTTSTPISSISTSTETTVPDTKTPSSITSAPPIPTPPEAPLPTPPGTPVSAPSLEVIAPTPIHPVPVTAETTIPKSQPSLEATESITPAQPSETSETLKTQSSQEAPTKTAVSPSPTEPLIPIQPASPTVTGPTPPTSPRAAPVESPLATKLKVETEVPATPPIVSSSSQPSLAAAPSEEPPVPPKRKGGSKASQDGKSQKGGKPAKGKK